MAQPPQQQIDYFPDFVYVPDELARALSDPLDMLKTAGVGEAFSPAEREDLDRIIDRFDDLFAAIAANDSVDTRVLLEGPAWTAVRNLAQATLERHGWQGPPSGGFSTFVPARRT